MHRFLTALIDIVFPPSTEALIVRTLSEDEVRALYTLAYRDDFVALAPFRDERIRALIHEAKFVGNDRAFLLLNILLEHHLRQTGLRYDVIVPIPLSPARLRARGYNQVLEILRASRPQRPPLPLVTNILIRTRHTKPQTSLTRRERLTNVAGAFRVKGGDRITGKHVLLVDDVATTGATLDAARNGLAQHHPASVTCLALAH